ncbi:MAG: GAF domain-containing protein [Nitrospirota bacterium]
MKLDVTSYLAVPLKDQKCQVLGHLVAMDVNPMILTSDEIEVFKLFGERAGVEIYRQVIEASLKEREATLRTIAEGTAQEVGVEFFGLLVKNLATALDVSGSTIAGGRVHALPLRRCGRRWDSVLRGYVPGRLLSPADDPGLRVEWRPDSTSL